MVSSPPLKKQQLSVVDFGRRLVETEDLDPVYCMLHNAQLEQRKLKRWLLAYLCFYHCGTASWIVDQPDYWFGMKMAASSKRWPRSSERRHFRGEFATKAVEALSASGVNNIFSMLTDAQPLALATMMKRVKTLYGFGDWIAFKVADVLERLGLCKILFHDADTFLFDSPKAGAELVVEKYATGGYRASLPASQWAFDYLKRHLGDMEAPPRYERKLNGQEFETILCKWIAHMEGRYPVGKDITEIRHGLLKFSTCKTSQLLLKCLPKEVA